LTSSLLFGIAVAPADPAKNGLSTLVQILCCPLPSALRTKTLRFPVLLSSHWHHLIRAPMPLHLFGSTTTPRPHYPQVGNPGPSCQFTPPRKVPPLGLPQIPLSQPASFTANPTILSQPCRASDHPTAAFFSTPGVRDGTRLAPWA